MPRAVCLSILKLGLGLLLLAGGSASFAAPPPLEVYGNLPGFEMAALSPSGDKVAIVGTLSGKRMLLVLGPKKELLHRAGIGDDTKVRGLYWAGENTVLLETSVTSKLDENWTADKAELFTMIVVPLGGGDPWTVFGHEQLIRGGIQGFFGLNERDGEWHGYFSGVTLELVGEDRRPLLSNSNPVLYDVNLSNGKFKAIAPRPDSQGIYRDWLVDPDGNPSVTLDFNSRDGRWRIYNDKHGEIASGIDPRGRIGLVGFGETPNTVIFSKEDKDSGVVHWFEAPISVEGTSKEILADQDVDGALFDRQTRKFIGYRNYGDVPTYHFFDPYQDKVVAAAQKAFPGQSVELVQWNEAFNRLIVETEGPGDPQNWWIVDIKAGSADPLGKSYVIPAQQVAPMKMIHYKAQDGMDIPAVLTLPPGRPAKNLPVVVLPHGGPGARDYPGFDWWPQALAVQGYAVLQPNFRGSAGYGPDFERAGNGEWGRKMQTDISDGLAQLVKDGIVDGKRACIVGASYGGYAALAGVTLQQGLYRCAVAVAGVSDVHAMAATDLGESGGNKALKIALKEEIGSGHDLSEVSPIKFADKADAPILLIHGKDDTVVNYQQSVDMADALRKAGKTVDFVTMPEGDHWLSRSANRLAMLQATVAFVEKYNPPDPAPNP